MNDLLKVIMLYFDRLFWLFIDQCCEFMSLVSKFHMIKFVPSQILNF